jgi:hypothetical protein
MNFSKSLLAHGLWHRLWLTAWLDWRTNVYRPNFPQFGFWTLFCRDGRKRPGGTIWRLEGIKRRVLCPSSAQLRKWCPIEGDDRRPWNERHGTQSFEDSRVDTSEFSMPLAMTSHEQNCRESEKITKLLMEQTKTCHSGLSVSPWNFGHTIGEMHVMLSPQVMWPEGYVNIYTWIRHGCIASGVDHMDFHLNYPRL